MAFQPAPACANVSMPYYDVSDGSFVGENSLNFKRVDNTAWTEPQLAQLLTDLADWWDEMMQPIFSIDVRQGPMVAKGLANAIDVYSVRATANDGTQTGDRAPANVTIAVAFKSGLTGRSANGRVYQCGMTETQISGNYVTSPYAAALLDAWTALPDAVDPGIVQHVILSRWGEGVRREIAVPFPVLSYALTDTRVDTRRKRLNG